MPTHLALHTSTCEYVFYRIVSAGPYNGVIKGRQVIGHHRHHIGVQNCLLSKTFAMAILPGLLHPALSYCPWVSEDGRAPTRGL